MVHMYHTIQTLAVVRCFEAAVCRVKATAGLMNRGGDLYFVFFLMWVDEKTSAP